MPATKNPNSPPATHIALLSTLTAAFPDFSFRPGQRFAFRAHTITYALSDPHFPLLILHELGHAILGHSHFSTHVERLRIERAAWDTAADLCRRFSVPYDPDFVEEQLDSYRDWLHSKSRCPHCGLTRYQTSDGCYHCPHCN